MDEKMIPSQAEKNEAAPVAKAASEKKESPFWAFLERTRSGKLPVLASFLLPFLIFSLFCALEGMYPFGDGQFINYDGWHQYYPFVLKLWDHFHEGTSLLYDWSMGMGTNFLSMLSYYGASPLNLLLLLVPGREFRLLFMLFVPLRIGLAGLFAYLFMRKVFRNTGWTAVFFSMGYALCGYILGYFWNMMWLDTVALLPLLALAFLKLFREGKSSLYVIVLAISLFSNYYIGYMSCLFIALSFFVFCVIDKVSFSGFVKKGFRLLLTTLLGAGMTAILLLPAFFGLMNTASTTGEVGVYVSFYESIRDLFAPLASFHVPAVMDGLPNLATAAVISLFAFAFLWAKRIPFREKMVSFILLALLLFSMNFSVTNYIWHGMHFTNMIPYRFAFLFAFVIVVMAYRYYGVGLAGFDLVDGVGMLLFAALVAFSAYSYYPNESILVTVAVFAAVTVLCVLASTKLLSRRVMSLILCIVLTAELSAATYLGVREVGTTSYEYYFDGEKGEAVQNAVDLAAEREKDGDLFYRMEGTEWRSLNDSCFYNYNGISQFASSANRNVSRFMEEVGMPADDGSNRFVYVHGTALMDTLLGIKYLISRNGTLTDDGLVAVTPTDHKTNIALYENEAFLGLGFMVNAAAGEFSFTEGDYPYQKQNALFRALTGLEGDLFRRVEPINGEQLGLSASRGENGMFEFVSVPGENGEETEHVLRLNYTMPSSGNVYIYADVPMGDYVQVNNAWHCIEEYPNFFSAGYFSSGESFVLRSVIGETGDQEFSSTALFHVCVMDTELWEKGLEKLRQGQMKLTSFDDTSLSATVTANENGYLYTSIPMELERSWTVLVDGEKAEVTPFAGAFVGLYLEKGEHTLSFSYSPAGFEKGSYISIVSILIFIALAVAEKKGFRLFREKEATPLMEREDVTDDVARELPEQENPHSENEEKQEEAQGEQGDHTEADESHP